MPSLKTIRKRISSVKSTQKITRAMKMVAGARLARAQQRIVALRPYAVKTGEVLKSVAASMSVQPSPTAEGGALDYAVAQKAPHPLLERRPEKKVLYVVLSSDRGLCGAFNTNVIKAAEREWRAKQDAGVEVEFATCGRKARDYLARRSAKIDNDFARIFDGLDLDKAKLVAEWVTPRYVKKEWDAVYVIFTEFKSAISQKVVVDRLLPLSEPSAAEAEAAAGREFLYEPDPTSLLERLVPMYIEITAFRALLESQASEYGARMTAMDAATRNAKEMIGRLTLMYNRARQAAITKELMEIIGGAEALKE